MGPFALPLENTLKRISGIKNVYFLPAYNMILVKVSTLYYVTIN